MSSKWSLSLRARGDLVVQFSQRRFFAQAKVRLLAVVVASSSVFAPSAASGGDVEKPPRRSRPLNAGTAAMTDGCSGVARFWPLSYTLVAMAESAPRGGVGVIIALTEAARCGVSSATVGASEALRELSNEAGISGMVDVDRRVVDASSPAPCGVAAKGS